MKQKTRWYNVFKDLGESLVPMGGFEGKSKQDAINNMARRGNLSGSDWACNYIAIPLGAHLKRYNVKIS